MKQICNLNKKDWIILRLLYLTLATDTSSINIKDVNETRKYAEDTYGNGTLMVAFEMIRFEHLCRGEFNNPASNAMRQLEKNVPKDDEELLRSKGWVKVTKDNISWYMHKDQLKEKMKGPSA